jgi:hypothetical protein
MMHDNECSSELAFGALPNLTFKRSILRNDNCCVAQIHPHHASVSWAILRTDDSLFRDYGWSAYVRAARGRSWQYLRHPKNILVHLSQLHKKGRFTFLRERLFLPTRLSLIGLSGMLPNLRFKSLRKQRRHPMRFP